MKHFEAQTATNFCKSQRILRFAQHVFWDGWDDVYEEARKAEGRFAGWQTVSLEVIFAALHQALNEKLQETLALLRREA